MEPICSNRSNRQSSKIKVVFKHPQPQFRSSVLIWCRSRSQFPFKGKERVQEVYNIVRLRTPLTHELVSILILHTRHYRARGQMIRKETQQEQQNQSNPRFITRRTNTCLKEERLLQLQI